MSLYKNKFAFSSDYLPNELPHREKQIADLMKHFNLVSKEITPRHMFIHGAFGSGKTVVIRTVMDKIKEICRDKLPLKIAHIHCRDKSSTFNLMQQLSLQCSTSLIVSNTRIDLFQQLTKFLKETKAFFIFILDEMNKAPFKEIIPILHHFSRIGQTTGVCISNNPQALRNIPPDTHDSFRYTTYNFPPYDAIELLGILQYRSKLALNEGVIGEGVLNYFAKMGAATGSARYALSLLSSSATIVSEKIENEGKFITLELAKEMPSYVEDKAFQDSVLTMPIYYKLIFQAFQEATKKYPTPTVEYLYRRWCASVSNEGLDVLSKRRFRDFLTELKSKGFIDIVKHGKGRRKGWDYYVYIERFKEIVSILGKRRNPKWFTI